MNAKTPGFPSAASQVLRFPPSPIRGSGRRIAGSIYAATFFLLLAAPLLLGSNCDDVIEEEGGSGSPAIEIPASPPISPNASTEWLRTEGNGIVRQDGTIWAGRGMNIHDTRGCNACTYESPSVDEVKRRIDEAVDVWGADFLRLNMESYGSRNLVHGEPITADSDYLDDIVEIIDHIGSKEDVHVLLSLWHDPSFNSMGWPTPATAEIWEILTVVLQDRPHVMFGLVNEPQDNFDGSLDAEVWLAMNDTVERIRSVEAGLGVPNRIIAVQGTRAWARWLDYYVENPITAGDGTNIVYETHVYNPAEDFEALFETPSRYLPVLIGEFGPLDMSLDDTELLMERAEALEIPFLAWTFHHRCPPNLLVDHTSGGCGVDMPLEPTPWGLQLMERLAQE